MHVVVPPGGCFRELRKIELGPRMMTVGRAEHCEIRVDVPGVDDEHAKLSETLLAAVGPDCAVGDVPLDAGQRRLVMPGDEVQIGSVVLALEDDAPASVAASNHLVEIPALTATRPPRVRVAEGQNVGAELYLVEEGREYVVGRAPSCDLVLEDREVSREHLKLVRQGYVVHIRDQSSTRGSWLGRSTVYPGATIEWTRPRMLRVGATVLALSVPDAVRRAGGLAQASAPMTPEPRRKRSVPPAPSAGPPPFVSRGAADPPAFVPRGSDPPPSSPGGVEDPLLGVAYAPASDASGNLLEVAPSIPPPDAGSRTAWRKPGPSLGKAATLALLAIAGLAIAGGLLVMFSLLE